MTVFYFAAHCYIWDQTVAKNGLNEASSGIYKFLKMKASAGIKKFHFWTNDYGPYKNFILINMYFKASKELGINIIHR